MFIRSFSIVFYSRIYLFIPSIILKFIRIFAQSLRHLFIHSLHYSFFFYFLKNYFILFYIVHSFIHSIIHSFFHSFICMFTFFIYLFIFSFLYLFIYFFIYYLFTYSLTFYSFYSFLNLFMLFYSFICVYTSISYVNVFLQTCGDAYFSSMYLRFARISQLSHVLATNWDTRISLTGKPYVYETLHLPFVHLISCSAYFQYDEVFASNLIVFDYAPKTAYA